MKKRLGITIVITAVSGGLLLFAQGPRSGEVQFKAAQNLEQVAGDLSGAIEAYQQLVDGSDRELAARALVAIGECYEKLGAAESRRAYERVIQEFADQADPVTTARARLAALDSEADGGTTVVRQLAEADYAVAASSHDGRYVSIRRSAGYFVRGLAAETERLVVSAPRTRGVEMGPAIFSDDDSKLAYTTDGWVGSNVWFQIHVVGLDGQGDRVVYEDRSSYQRLDLADWSPTGDRILAVGWTRDNACQLLLVDVASGSGDVRDRFPACPYPADAYGHFSPDGRYILFGRRNASREPRDIYSIPVEGGEPVPVIAHPADDSPVGWTADGRLVFQSDRSTSTGIWVVEVRNGRATGEPEILKRDIGNVPSNNRVTSVGPAGFGRNGALFFGRRTRTQELYTATLDIGSGRLVSKPTAISSRFGGVNTSPGYSPDGHILAYVTGPDDSRTIQFRNLETGEERALPQPVSLQSIYDLRWFPDGREVLLDGRQKDNTLVFYRMDAETGKGSVLLSESITSDAATNPTFDPTGEWLYFKTQLGDEDVNRIVRYHLADGRLETVVEPSADDAVRLFALSADGQQLAIVRRKTGNDRLEVMPATGGQPRKVYTFPEGSGIRGWGALRFTADGKALLHAQTVGGLSFYDDQLMLTPLDGSPTRVLADTKMIHRIVVHPDGRQIAWWDHNLASELWVMENLAPAQSAER